MAKKIRGVFRPFPVRKRKEKLPSPQKQRDTSRGQIWAVAEMTIKNRNGLMALAALDIIIHAVNIYFTLR